MALMCVDCGWQLTYLKTAIIPSNFGLDWNALFRVDKIVEKKSNERMHNTSSSS